MTRFDGFPPGRARHVKLPARFFTDLLPLIDDLAELQVTLFAFYALQQRDGAFRYLRRADFADSEPLTTALVAAGGDLDAALRRAVERGALLAVALEVDGERETLYFGNTETGRAAVDQVRAGAWRPGDLERPIEILPERPNIYQLYEANIGPLTPMIGEALKNAEADYPPVWIEEAFREAVASNARSWRYIRAILERWDTEGRDRGVTEQHPQGDGRKYISGEYAAFIKYFRRDDA